MTKDDNPIYNFPERAFPMVIEYLNRHRVVVKREEVSGPGVLVVEGMAEVYGPMGVRMIFADGQVSEAPPPGGWAEP